MPYSYPTPSWLKETLPHVQTRKIASAPTKTRGLLLTSRVPTAAAGKLHAAAFIPTSTPKMSISPTKESIPTLSHPASIPSLHPPPSPGSHRALRRLKSAHTLGSVNPAPSLISQQHRQVLTRNLELSPKRRARANSDATNMTPPSAGSGAGRRPQLMRKSTSSDGASLDKLVREGPGEDGILGGLEAMRLRILDQGIKTDSDGMVYTSYLRNVTMWKIC